MPGTSVDLAVLGAGPAGLAAAWRASRRGLRVLVLERSDKVGGMAGSFEVAGIRVDHGSHRLHPAVPPYLLAEVTDLLAGDLQTRPRNGRLHVADRWVHFPLRPLRVARELPPALLARIAAAGLMSPLRTGWARSAPGSYAAALRRSLGPALYGALYEPFAPKLWGLDGEQISADQARRRVTADTPWRIAARAVGAGRGAVRGQGRVFLYPRRGFGQIVEALADATTAAGGVIRLGARVEEVEQHAGGVTVRAGDGGTVHAPIAFSTLPLPLLARLSRPGPPACVLQDAARLEFRAMLLVYLVHEGGRWTTFDAHYLSGPGTPVTRISEPANYRSDPRDPADRTVLCAEIPCSLADPLWRSDDATLAAVVQHALEITGLPPVRLAGVVVRRLPHCYPVYRVGYQERLAGLVSWSDRLPSVLTFGRLGLFAHDNTHHALTMAADAVAALGPGGTFDAAAWAAARARFAAHVVED